MARRVLSDRERLLLQTVLATPDDDRPRLAYAEWLQEHADVERRARGELISLQCALAERPDPLDGARRDRIKALLSAHRAVRRRCRSFLVVVVADGVFERHPLHARERFAVAVECERRDASQELLHLDGQ